MNTKVSVSHISNVFMHVSYRVEFIKKIFIRRLQNTLDNITGLTRKKIKLY